MMGDKTSSDQDHQDPFVQERLEALHEIDSKLVAILNHSSSALANFTNLKSNASNEERIESIQDDFQADIENFYKDLEYASAHLKKEIKTLDDHVGKTDANNITMLPININKKATWAGTEKLKSQMDALSTLLNADKVQDKA